MQINKGLLPAIAIIIMLFCSSCSQVSNDTKRIRPGKIDYKKAALLNVEIGRHYLSTGYIERAKKKFLHALELMPNLAEAHGGMAYFWEVVGEDKEAEKHYRKSISLGKGAGVFYDQYAIFLCERDRYQDADKNFNLALRDKLSPKTADIYKNAGKCAIKNKEQKKAVDYFTKALYHDPRSSQTLMELAKISLEQNNFFVAQNHLEEFNKLSAKPTVEYLLLSIKAAKSLGQKDIVASKGLLLKNLYPNSPECDLYKQQYESS
jgi:type IV pilus assembly protein PilF